MFGRVTGLSLDGCNVANAIRVVRGPSCSILFRRRARSGLRNFSGNRRARLNTIGMVANICANHSPGSGFVMVSRASGSAM